MLIKTRVKDYDEDTQVESWNRYCFNLHDVSVWEENEDGWTVLYFHEHRMYHTIQMKFDKFTELKERYPRHVVKTIDFSVN